MCVHACAREHVYTGLVKGSLSVYVCIRETAGEMRYRLHDIVIQQRGPCVLLNVRKTPGVTVMFKVKYTMRVLEKETKNLTKRR